MYRVSDDLALVLTVDFFPPIVDDAYTYGEISAANSLSDVYAMGGRPVTALNVAAIPEDLPLEVFATILRGGAEKAAEAGVTIIGGHTVTDDEPKYGMAVTGFIHPDRIITNSSARPGDRLVLTKPIGTGIISTAGKAQEAPEEVLANAARVMAMLNKGAAEAMIEVGVNAATDVTGYGLIGHLSEMARGSGAGVTISRSAIPVLPGTLELLSRAHELRQLARIQVPDQSQVTRLEGAAGDPQHLEPLETDRDAVVASLLDQEFQAQVVQVLDLHSLAPCTEGLVHAEQILEAGVGPLHEGLLDGEILLQVEQLAPSRQAVSSGAAFSRHATKPQNLLLRRSV